MLSFAFDDRMMPWRYCAAVFEMQAVGRGGGKERSAQPYGGRKSPLIGVGGILSDCEEPFHEVDGANHANRYARDKNERPHDRVAGHGGVGAQVNDGSRDGRHEEAEQAARQRKPPPLSLVGFEYADNGENRRHGADSQHGPGSPKTAHCVMVVEVAARSGKRCGSRDEEYGKRR